MCVCVLMVSHLDMTYKHTHETEHLDQQFQIKGDV
jgi:hypothetical protein